MRVKRKGRRKFPCPSLEGHRISKLKCVEIKGRGHDWSALFCDPEHKQWCTLKGKPNESALRSMVTQCRRNPGKDSEHAPIRYWVWGVALRMFLK